MASISTLVSLGLVGLSFATDNWKHISVNRGNLNKVINSTNIASNSSHDVNHQDLHNEPRYFDRVEGLFRVCFPMAEKPQRHDHDIYLSPLMSEWCTNIEYYVHLIMEDGLVPDKMTINGKIWIHLARSVIASFCLYFAFMAVACFIGLMGCYQMSDTKVIWTASLMMIAFFMGTAGMGLYHAADHYERYKVRMFYMRNTFSSIISFFRFMMNDSPSTKLGPKYSRKTPDTTSDGRISWLGSASC